MDGALGRNLDPGEPAHQALANLTRTPAGVFALNVQDVVLYLEGSLLAHRQGRRLRSVSH